MTTNSSKSSQGNSPSKLTKDDCFASDNGLLIACSDWEKTADQILKNQDIIKKLEYRKNYPMAFNYAQFEAWVTDILIGGDGFPLPKELLGEKEK